MDHPILKLVAVVITVLVLTACDDTYYDNGNQGGGYYPPAHDASKSELIKNCKGRIREKVRNRIGYNTKFDWGKTDMYNSSRHETTINGKGTARNKGRKHKMRYTCVMNRRDAYVRSARVELDNDHDSGGGSGNWNQKAIHACKERIRYQAKRNIHQPFSLEFTKQQITTPAERRRHVTGRALVKGRNGNGKIAYDCKLHVNPLRVDSAGYRWLKPLPVASGGGGYGDAKRLCQDNLRTRLHAFGYSKIRFLSSSVQPLPGNKKKVRMEVKAKKVGDKVVENYECHVNTRNGKVLKMEKLW